MRLVRSLFAATCAFALALPMAACEADEGEFEETPAAEEELFQEEEGVYEEEGVLEEEGAIEDEGL